MKKTKLIIPAMGILLLSAAASATGTVAWFTVSKTVTANGMKVRAQAPGNLVITNAAVALPTASTTSINVNYAITEAIGLYPSTHDETNGGNTKLAYVTNSDKINAFTGVQKDSDVTSKLAYAEALNSNGVTYYKDFSCFIASSGSALTAQTITITIDGAIGDGKNINKAISVDFYTCASTATVSPTPATANYSYAGALNLADLDPVTNNGQAEKKEIKLSNITIPKADGNAAVGVIMRVYYDGALLETRKGTGDPVTAYAAATGTATNTGAYYSKNGDIYDGVSLPTGTSLSGFYTIDDTKTSYAFCRTAKIADISDIDLGVRFVADNYTA